MEFKNPFYQEEADRLFQEMIQMKAKPEQLLKYLKLMQHVARGNDNVLIYGIRKFHKIVTEEGARRMKMKASWNVNEHFSG